MDRRLMRLVSLLRLLRALETTNCDAKRQRIRLVIARAVELSPPVDAVVILAA